jgi:hypothetical protein
MTINVYLTIEASTNEVFLQRAKCRLLGKDGVHKAPQICYEWRRASHFTTQTLRISETGDLAVLGIDLP